MLLRRFTSPLEAFLPNVCLASAIGQLGKIQHVDKRWRVDLVK